MEKRNFWKGARQVESLIIPGTDETGVLAQKESSRRCSFRMTPILFSPFFAMTNSRDS